MPLHRLRNIVERSNGRQRNGRQKCFPLTSVTSRRARSRSITAHDKHGEVCKLLAGGHSLIPAMKLRLQSPQTFDRRGHRAGLRGVSVTAGHL